MSYKRWDHFTRGEDWRIPGPWYFNSSNSSHKVGNRTIEIHRNKILEHCKILLISAEFGPAEVCRNNLILYFFQLLEKVLASLLAGETIGAWSRTARRFVKLRKKPEDLQERNPSWRPMSKFILNSLFTLCSPRNSKSAGGLDIYLSILSTSH